MVQMRKIAIIVMAVIAGGLIYLGVQHRMHKNNDSVVIQKCRGLGALCKHDSSCCSKKCKDGTCRSSKCVGLGLSCKHDGTCCSKNCSKEGMCEKSKNGAQCNRNVTCQSDNCIDGICGEAELGEKCRNGRMCKSGRCEDKICVKK